MHPAPPLPWQRSRRSASARQRSWILVISDLGDAMAPSLGDDITLTFDANLVGLVSAAFGDPVLGDQLDLSGLGTVSDVVLGPGSVNLFELFSIQRLFNLPRAGAFVFAQLTLIGKSPGTSSLGVVVTALSDADGSPLPANPTGGSLDVIAAPVPPATLIYLRLALPYSRYGDTVALDATVCEEISAAVSGWRTHRMRSGVSNGHPRRSSGSTTPWPS